MPDNPRNFKELIPVLLNWDTILGGTASISLVLQRYEIAISIFLAAILRRVLARVGRRIEEKLGQHFDSLVVRLFESIEDASRWFWWRLPLRFQPRYCRNLVYRYRKSDIAGPKRGFNFLLENMYVPLQVTVQTAAKTPLKPIRPRRKARILEVWDFLAASKEYETYKQIAILGKPGSGKTTLMKHLALTYAKNKHRREHRNSPKLIPTLLYIREAREQILSQKRPDLALLIESQEWIQALKPPPQWFKTRLMRQRCLVLIDGLDEVADDTELKRISRWIDRQIQLYPGNRFVISSRPFGYRSEWLSSMGAVLEVRPFGFKQTEQFIQKWYFQCELMNYFGKPDPGVRQQAEKDAGDLIARIKNHPPIMAMADNPLLVNMIVRIHREEGVLPKSRAELYAEACRVLLRQRREERDIPGNINLKASQKLFLLQKLALGLMRTEEIEFSLGWAKEIIQQDLVNLARDRNIHVKDFLKFIENTSGLLLETNIGIYEFSHRSLQEYLASFRVKELNQPNLLLNNLEKQWWSETIRLYAAQTDATEIIRTAFNQATGGQQENVVVFKLAYDCLEECPNVSIEDRAEFEAWIDASLQSSDRRLKRYAAEVKLLQRFEQLKPIDGVTKLDPTYITCGEYQLFIDEKAALGEYHQPDFWRSRQCPPPMAQNPVTGVRARDAVEFCRWLTDRYLQTELLQYRLPTSEEEAEEAMTANSVQSDEFGCWCYDAGKYAIVGLTAESLQRWQGTIGRIVRNDSLIAKRVYRNLKHARGVISELARANKQTLPRQLDDAINLNFSAGIFDPLGLDLSNIAAPISSLRSIHEINQMIVLARQRAKYYELGDARELVKQLARSLERIPLSDLDRCRKLATEFAESFGLSNYPDRSRLYDLVREIAETLVDELSLAIVQAEARLRDIQYILDSVPELVPSVDLNFSWQVGRSLARELRSANSHKQNFRRRIARTVDDIGLWHLRDATLVDNINSNFKLVCSREYPLGVVNSDFDFENNENGNDFELVWPLDRTRSYLLMGAAFWYSLGHFYSNAHQSPQRWWRLRNRVPQNLKQDYTTCWREAAQAYALMAMLDEQSKTQNLSLGGIRIVQESLSEV